jgi:zinc transport system substrate-binding protein
LGYSFHAKGLIVQLLGLFEKVSISISSVQAILLIFCCVIMAPAAQAEKLHVLASIKPIQLMVKAVAGDAIDVEVLLAPQQSPHNYQLRPSDRRKLADAAQVYWIGPSMETFLARTVLGLPADRVQTLGRFLPDTGDHDLDHDHHTDHVAIEADPHLWLDYQQIILMSAQIEQSLSELMPENKLQFAANRRAFLDQLKQVDARAVIDFSSLATRGFIMSHAAYGRLLQHYQLLEGIALSDTHGRVAGAKHLQAIERYIAEKSPQCFLLDPSETSSMQANFAQRYNLTTITADAMAISIAPTQNGFVAFYQQLVSSVLSCLQSGEKK